MKKLLLPFVLFLSHICAAQIEHSQAANTMYTQPSAVSQPVYSSANSNNVSRTSYSSPSNPETYPGTPAPYVNHTSAVQNYPATPPAYNDGLPHYHHEASVNDGIKHTYRPHSWRHSAAYEEPLSYDPGYDCYNFAFTNDGPAYTYINYAFNDPFNGFIVYKGDTLNGFITLTNEQIYFEQPIDSTSENMATISWSDEKLQSVVMYNDYDKQELFLTHPIAGKNSLARVVHSGKVNVYDDRYNFFSNPQQIDIKKLRVMANGKSIAVSKKEFALLINETYNTQLNYKNKTWGDLLLYLDKLN